MSIHCLLEYRIDNLLLKDTNIDGQREGEVGISAKSMTGACSFLGTYTYLLRFLKLKKTLVINFARS